MGILDSITQGFNQNKTAQTGALQNFASKYAPQSVAGKQVNTPFIGPVGMSKIPSGTTAGVKTPQNTVQNTVQGPTLPTKPQQYGSPQIGFFDDYDKAVAAANAYNPSSVNLKVDDTIKSEALNTVPSPTTLSEARKGKERSVLTSRFQEEEEKLLTGIAKQRDFLNRLVTEQDREFLSAEKNPTGQLIGGLNSDLSRLSKEQAIELNARTGQLNSMLDTLELYQGYRPQMIGSPVIDDVTGEAFAYIQDPYTGEIFTESMGNVATPQVEDPNDNLISLSEGEAVWDPISQSVVYKNPRTGQPSSGGGSFSGFGGGGSGENRIGLIIDQLGAGISSENQREAFYNTAANLVAHGDQKELNNFLRRTAVGNLGIELKGKYINNLNVIEQLDDLEEILAKIEAKGVDSNIFKGTWQTIQKKIGLLGDPELANLAFQAQNTMDIIARTRTGAAFTKAEDTMYRSMVPGVFKTAALNSSQTRNLRQSIENSLDSAVGLGISSDSSRYLSELESGPRPSVDQLFTDEMFQ